VQFVLPPGDDRQAQPFCWSLTVVNELLKDIANQLDRPW
jgi:hypothetical protein